MVKKHKKIVLVGFIASITLASIALSAKLNAKTTAQEKQELSKLESYIKFTRVMNFIEAEYVDEVNTSDLIDKALNGMLQNLDPHSSFLDKNALEQMNIQTKGEFGGLGISIGKKNGVLTIISPIDNTPAYHAGVKSGDVIVKIDDKNALEMELDEAVSIMRGKPKTSIELTIAREGESKPLVFKIVRDIIKLDSVYTKKIDAHEDLLYIRVATFDAKVVKDVTKAIKENPAKKGIILDLRNNSGGLLDQAVGLVDIFVDKGIIVSQKGKAQPKEEYRASKLNTLTKLPLVVLINGGSASASEIVSGALQDHKRAVLVGELTFGKGSVQQIRPISQTEAVKLTTAKYFLPSDRTIQAVGVTPDVEVAFGEILKSDKDSFEIKEKDLKKHLESELFKVETKKSDKENNASQENNATFISKEIIYQDGQLKSAIDILKALITLNKEELKQ
ncbi:MAG: peptidase S41 [Sulfurovum sp. PC08-66]|nr:MAG: peptidase S41 [Sulfurovum sp. PC08-66]